MSKYFATRSQPAPAAPFDPLANGIRLFDAGDYTEACRCFEQILKKDPQHRVALWQLGRTLLRLKKREKSIEVLQQAVALCPAAADPLFDLGAACLGAERFEEAVQHYSGAVALKPDWSQAWSKLGLAQCRAGRLAEAETSLLHALKLRPNDASALNDFGTVLGEKGQPELAAECYLRAIQLSPEHAEPWCNLGRALTAQNKIEEAFFAYRQALKIDPKNCVIKFNYAVSRLTKGELSRETWLGYEFRWVALAESPQRTFSQPLWQGLEPLAGKTILLHHEQGLGDTIQFVRYARELTRQGATVRLHVQAALKPLLADFPGVASVTSHGDPMPQFDFHCPYLSLPFAFGTRVETIPSGFPYLHAPAEKIELWRERLPSRGRAPRIGVVWRGNPKHRNDRNRSMPFETFRHLFATPGCEFVALQVGLNETESSTLAAHPNCINPTEQITDFADTAAIISQLDAIVAVDTSVAHVAGALGKPVWLLIPFAPDWRWMLDREDSPWYPSMRIFRQPTLGDWESVIAKVNEQLAHKVSCASVAA